MFSVYFRDGAVRTYDDARDQDTAAFGRFFHATLDAGVYLPPSAFESWFVSGAHDDAAVDRALAVLPAAPRAAAKCLGAAPRAALWRGNRVAPGARQSRRRPAPTWPIRPRPSARHRISTR